jgi:hypothetical protein
MTRADFQALAEERINDAGALLNSRRFSGAYYSSGLAVECALKACVAKNTRQFDFPQKRQPLRFRHLGRRGKANVSSRYRRNGGSTPMATYPLVERINLDLPALVALSLQKHGVPVSDRFLIRYDVSQWQVVIISPAVDEAGRDVYLHAFEALDREAFSTRQFLSSHLLLLGEKQSREPLDRLRKGVTRLSSLGPYEEVDVYVVPEADKIEKRGFLHFVPSGNDGFLVGFAGLDRDGEMKTLPVSVRDLDTFLAGFSVYEGDKQKVIDSLRQNHSESIFAGVSLRTLYEKGLV